MSDLADIELSLRRKDATRYLADLVFSQPGSAVEVRPLVKTDVTVSFDEARLRELALDPVGYGRALGQMLFADSDLAVAFAQARAAAASQRRTLRIRLAIAGGLPELHALRWETLRDPRDDLALALSEQLVFTRTLHSADWQPVALRAKGELKALVVVANPDGLGSFGLAALDREAEVRAALAGLESVPSTVLAAPGEASLARIVARLRAGIDILYLVAHGTIVDGEPWLMLDDGHGAVARVLGADLAAQLAALPMRPRLTVLASCLSAGDGSATVLAALGPRLAVAGIPAVVAMQGPLSIETNAHFTPVFFQELRRDGQIDRALAAARQAIAGRPDWWVPTLFTRLRSGRIWYEPGFDAKDFQRWPALLQSIAKGNCTPILGPGLLEPIAGSTRDLARRLAEQHAFPLAPFARDDLPQVTQYLAVNQSSVDFVRDEVARELREAILERAPAARADSGALTPLTALLRQAGAELRSAAQSEAHQVLAGLPVPIYLTANPDDLLAEALRAAGRQPEVVVCPWYVDEKHFAGADIDPPTVDRPLVYHMLGHLDEPESLVLTEDDHFRYLIGFKHNLELVPSRIQRALADTALLFLGFRFEDWSFRALLQSMLRLSGGGRRSRYAHVAVQIDPQEGLTLNPQAARKYLQDYFGPTSAQAFQANISVYWGSTEDFITELHKRLEERRAAGGVA